MQSSTPESAIPRPPTSLCSGLGPEQKAGTFAPTITERNDLIDIEAGVEVLVSDSPVAMRGLSCACQPIGRTQMRYSGAPGHRCRVALHGWSSRQRRDNLRSVARRPKSSFAGYGRTDCKRGVAPCQSSRRSHMSLSRSATLTAAASGISDFSVQIRSLTRTPVRFIRLFGR